MKKIAVLLLIVASSVSHSQTTKEYIHKNKFSKDCIKMEKPVLMTKETSLNYGDFEVSTYDVILKKSIVKKDLEKLIGTLIRIKETDITGDEIDPISIDNLGTEIMKKDDYLFRCFGEKSQTETTALPQSFNVYKTGRPECYGIAILSNSKLAIPYKGSLLYLDIKK